MSKQNDELGWLLALGAGLGIVAAVLNKNTTTSPVSKPWTPPPNPFSNPYGYVGVSDRDTGMILGMRPARSPFDRWGSLESDRSSALYD